VKRASDYLDEWSTEADEKVGVVQLIAAFLTFAFLIAVILGGAVLIAAWTNGLP
jgi:hypothetical protein